MRISIYGTCDRAFGDNALRCRKEKGGQKESRIEREAGGGESLITADNPCAYGARYESVMCRGTAVIVEDTEEKMEALKILMKTQTGEEHEINEKMAAAVNVIRVDAESYTAKACVRQKGETLFGMMGV